MKEAKKTEHKKRIGIPMLVIFLRSVVNRSLARSADRWVCCCAWAFADSLVLCLDGSMDRWMWQWQLLFVMFGACMAPMPGSPPLAMLSCWAAVLLFCVVIADATRFARCLIWKLQQIGSEWAIYRAGGISLTWHSRHAYFLAWQDFQASPSPPLTRLFPPFWPFGHNENFRHKSRQSVCALIKWQLLARRENLAD